MKNLRRDRVNTWLILLLIAFLFSACAEATDVEACTTSEPYGFIFGLWHGIISPIAFIISLFSDEVAMYAINNTGGWYDFGFILGASMSLGGGGHASKRRRK